MSSRGSSAPRQTFLIPPPDLLAQRDGRTVVESVRDARPFSAPSAPSVVDEDSVRVIAELRAQVARLRSRDTAQMRKLAELRRKIRTVRARVRAGKQIIKLLVTDGRYTYADAFGDYETLKDIVDIELAGSVLIQNTDYEVPSLYLDETYPAEVCVLAQAVGHALTPAQWALLGRASAQYQSAEDVAYCIQNGHVIFDLDDLSFDVDDLRTIAHAYESIGAQDAADEIWNSIS